MTALRNIGRVADNLDKLALEGEQGNPVDPTQLRVEARRLRAQLEMIEQKLED